MVAARELLGAAASAASLDSSSLACQLAGLRRKVTKPSRPSMRAARYMASPKKLSRMSAETLHAPGV